MIFKTDDETIQSLKKGRGCRMVLEPNPFFLLRVRVIFKFVNILKYCFLMQAQERSVQAPQSRSLQELVGEGSDVRLLLAHDQIIPTIKNQDPILAAIFTPANTQTLISFLNQQHPLDTANPELSYKLPHIVLEILCCECHLLTDLIFTHSYQPDKLLLDYLLQFLDYSEHYLLASYFSKTMIAISKRVFSPEHKFNEILCKRVFPGGGLMKCLNHVYSASTNELVIRWLTMKGKNNDYIQQKKQFLSAMLTLLNGQPHQHNVLNFNDMSLESSISLILLFLKSSLEPAPTQPQPTQHKNLNLMLSKANQKELYSFICEKNMLREILKPVPNPTIYKIRLVQKMVEKLRVENQQLQLQTETYTGQYLAQQLSFQMLSECLEWGNQHILDLVTEYWDSEKNQFTQNFPKKNLLVTLDLLYELHLLPDLFEPLSYYYEEKETEHVEGIVKLLRLKNNIVSTTITKIMMIVLKKLKCPDFARTLLHEGISQVIDEEGIREHILQWAKVILQSKAEQGHIYENPIEEAQWDHMTSVIEAAQQIQIGNYRFKPANIPIFYSTTKAKQTYSEFLKQPIYIQYEQKQNELAKLKKTHSNPQAPPNKIQQPVKIPNRQEEPRQEDDEVEILPIDLLKIGYLSYDVDKLMSDL